MPNYPNIPATMVADRNAKYKKAKEDLPRTTDQQEINRLKGLMTLYEEEVKEQLEDDFDVLKASWITHQKNIDDMVKAAQEDVKYANKIAASFKKDHSKTEFIGQMEHLVKKAAKYEPDALADAKAFGDAWKDHRANAALNFPASVTGVTEVIRKQVITDSKEITAKIEIMKAAAAQTVAVSTIMDKARRKSVGGTKRDMPTARRAAVALAVQLKAMEDDAKSPPGRAGRPESIASNAKGLVENANNKDLTKNPRNLADSDGRWSQVQSSWSQLNTKSVKMVNVVEASKKGFHSDELKDAAVKVEFGKAIASVNSIKAEVKKYAKDYANAKAAIAKIKAAFAKVKK